VVQAVQQRGRMGDVLVLLVVLLVLAWALPPLVQVSRLHVVGLLLLLLLLLVVVVVAQAVLCWLIQHVLAAWVAVLLPELLLLVQVRSSVLLMHPALCLLPGCMPRQLKQHRLLLVLLLLLVVWHVLGRGRQQQLHAEPCSCKLRTGGQLGH
jgi:hypothetical protein